MNYPVIDLHCDLLSYLETKKGRTPLEEASRCSYPQLQKGNVMLQTMAVFTMTRPGSSKAGQAQVDFFQKILQDYPDQFQVPTSLSCFEKKQDKVYVLAAFENASGFCEEEESLTAGLNRLDHFTTNLGKILYVGLTWDGENRFGGGNGSNVGLKEDGKTLLQHLHQKKIAVDFSHTSDRLAYDILDYTDKHSLDIPLLASHSNFRAISNWPRNLPDDIAKELIRREGIIGLNLFAPFITKGEPKKLLAHVEHAFKLNGEKTLSFGADFFCDADFPILYEKYQTKDCFFPEYGSSAFYPTILTLLQNELSLSGNDLRNIASKNALEFIKKLYSK
jgi:membrane dipeptidase